MTTYTYTPNQWVVIKITTPTATHHKVFASWDDSQESWRFNSGITQTTVEDGLVIVYGSSGSVYILKEDEKSYGMNGVAEEKFDSWIRRLTLTQSESIIEVIAYQSAIEHLYSMIQ